MKVLYFSSVVPSRLNAGYMLMHRHLSRMREHDVLIVTREFEKTRELDLPHASILIPERSRNYLRIAHRIGSPLFWLEREAARLRRIALPHAQAFRPDVVLTVWTSAYLLAAADLARQMHVPLAIVFHDNFEHMLALNARRRAWATKRLGDIFRQARARICVGPGMVDHLTRLYGDAPTDVVYPIPEEPESELPPSRTRGPQEPLRIGFFGELGGNYGPIGAVVDLLAECGAEFHFFSHSTGPEREALASRPRVFDHGATDPRSLHAYFRANLDVVMIPQGFEAEELQLRRTCFPSKLPEACQLGMPLLVVGPSQGSAVRWARDHLEASAVVETLDRGAILRALQALRDPAARERHRVRIAQAASESFSPAHLHRRFEAALRRAHPQARLASALPW